MAARARHDARQVRIVVVEGHIGGVCGDELTHGRGLLGVRWQLGNDVLWGWHGRSWGWIATAPAFLLLASEETAANDSCSSSGRLCWCSMNVGRRGPFQPQNIVQDYPATRGFPLLYKAKK